MFAEHSKAAWTWESFDISSAIAEAFEVHNDQFQCFMETANITVLHETAFIGSRFVQIIDGIMKFIRTAVLKFIAGFDVTIRRMEALVRKYEGQLNRLTDEDLSGVEYDRVKYTISSEVPTTADLSVIDWAIGQMSSVVSRDDMLSIRERLEKQLPFIRGQIMGMVKPVSESQVDSVVKGLFKKNAPIHPVPLTVDILREIMDDIKTYSQIKKSVEDSRDTSLKILSHYKDVVKSIYTEAFTPNADAVKVRLNGGTPTETSPTKMVYHREVQMLLTSIVMELSNLYSNLFNEKLTILKEKFEREQLILRQVIFVIQPNGRD